MNQRNANTSRSNRELNGPINSMKFLRLFMDSDFGFFKASLSTLSKGRVICPKSYNSPSISNCIGVSGRNGSKALAIITDITSPKLKLVASFIYFIKFAKVRLPSVTPSSKTFKSFSSSIISAASFAISTAVSTDMPTSEFVRDGLSLIPVSHVSELRFPLL